VKIPIYHGEAEAEEEYRDSSWPSGKKYVLLSSPGGVSRISRGRYSGPVKFVKHYHCHPTGSVSWAQKPEFIDLLEP
jgi:hypothetical protein